LQGVIDSPDIPLNVSRSYLQGDANVRKISGYITRKVADKLNEIFKEDRTKFEEKWRDISVFVKYGMMSDDKFYDKAEKFCLMENVDGNFFTLDAYREKIAPTQTDKDEKVVYLYTTDPAGQDMFIQGAASKDYDVLIMNGVIDSHFIGMLESKVENSSWQRVDANTLDKLVQKTEEAEDVVKLDEEAEKSLKAIFEGVIDKEGMIVQLANLGKTDQPVTIVRPEFMRRMKDMAAMGGGMAYMGQMPDTMNVVVNTQHSLVKQLDKLEDPAELAKQLIDLALLSQQMLDGKDLTQFIQRSVGMLSKKRWKKKGA
ncbi:MAG: molecular chaperone HtpG, partial [Bacteroidota bacterium]